MIIGTGHYVPPRILTNHDLEKMVDTTDQWIVERTGIRERHIREADDQTSEFCYRASVQALEEAGLAPADLDLIIIGTVTGDMIFPSTAIFLQAKLGAHNAAALDICAACSGFLYSMILGDGMISSGKYRHVLALGAESLSLITNWEDRNTCILFGDGAGAVVMAPSDGKRGVLSSYLGADGRLAHLLWSPGGGTRQPYSHEMIDQKAQCIRMAGRETFLHAVKAMGDAAERALAAAGVKASEVDLLIPHQANLRIIDATARRLNLPKDKVYVNIDRFGNTSSASLPIALNEARRTGRLKPGMSCLMVVFGGGFTWASALVQF